jgi:hypothetical protein
MPWQGFKLVDTVANDSFLLRFEVLRDRFRERTSSRAIVNLSCQRGTTAGSGTELQGLTSVGPVDVIIQSKNPSVVRGATEMRLGV